MDVVLPVRQIEGERRKLLGLILFRILIITVLMGSTTILNLRTGQTWTPVQKLILYSIGVIYLLSIFYLLAVKYNTSYRFQAITQLFVDVIFWSSLIYLTGGLNSPFTFLYTLSIIHGSILLGKRGAYMTCLMSFACFGVVIWFENYHIFHSTLMLTKSFDNLWNTRELYQIFLNLCMFAFITALAVRLASEVETREAALVTQRISLKVQQMLNRSIMAGINSGFVMIDRNGDITFMNVPAERLIGLTHHEAKGRNLSDVFNDLRDGIIRESKGEDWKRYVELKLDAESDSPRFLTFTFSNLLGGENDRVGSMVVIDDITERRRLEESLFRNQKLAAIGELAAGIAHEIRNPLASISGSIQMLRAEFPPGGDNEKLAEIILRETDRLNNLINDFLSYARPRPVDRLPINIHEIMEDITELLAQQPETDLVRVRVEYDHLTELSGDSGQIRQMLWNILKNAVEAASAKNPGVVWVKIGSKPGAPDHLMFSISDNGEGMSAEVQERIFDPFFTTKSSGTGLGMAIVYQVVKNHRGSIEVNSKPGNGTQFIITLPCHPSTASNDPRRSA
jgi:two-component system sensor histidine kinase PilS (NtrC family)